MFDILSLYIALIPLSIYLLVMGLVNLSRRPFVVSGVRDLGVLCLAATGFIVVGPMELFFPVEASFRFGSYVWLLLLAIFFLLIVLLLLAQRPRINIYNISLSDLRPILSDLAMELDPTARWAGDSLAMPKKGVQFYLEPTPALKNVSLVAYKKEQNLESWRILENSLRRGLRHVKSSHRRTVGMALFLTGLIMFILLNGMVWFYLEAFLAAIPNMLRM